MAIQKLGGFREPVSIFGLPSFGGKLNFAKPMFYGAMKRNYAESIRRQFLH
jgi:hypothetical protein